MKIKLTLDEKYREMVEDIRSVNNPNCSYYMDSYTEKIEALTRSWFDSGEIYEYQVKVIERIHSADEIEWIEHKYNWRLKSDKFRKRYIGIDILGGVLFFKQPEAADNMTESELKKLLEDTGLPFEAFEKVEADD
ncbi:hypothetical protein ACEN4A_05005 [Latilactobacillus sakei]|uniref:hypothetical protein n=1 Tax=Latilactobacillus sakei TaxID=1599 RepID=UPI00388BA3E2